MSSFVSNNAILVAVICGLIAVIYGVLLIRWLLKLPAGDEVMQKVAGAVQEGAKAYLNRQYRTIAMVGVVVFVVLLVALDFGRDLTYGWHAAVGFVVGACLSRRRRLHRHDGQRARQRAHRRGRAQGPRPGAHRRLPRRRRHRPARRRPRAARRVRLLLGHRRRRGPRRPRLRRLADQRVRARRRRHLHQGRRCGRRPRRQGRGGHPRGRPAQPGRHRRQRRRQRRRLRRHGRRPLRDLRRHRRGRHVPGSLTFVRSRRREHQPGRRHGDQGPVGLRAGHPVPARARRRLASSPASSAPSSCASARATTS